MFSHSSLCIAAITVVAGPLDFLISIGIFSSNFSFKLLFLARTSPSYNIPLDPLAQFHVL